MANATTAIDTRQQTGSSITLGVATNIALYAGTLACRNSSGYAVKGVSAASTVCMGVVRQTVDNTGGSNGAVDVECLRGRFVFNNSGTAALTIAHLGALAYIEDDNTVANTIASNAVAAGRFVGFETGTGLPIIDVGAP